jgi:hypothetical protein
MVGKIKSNDDLWNGRHGTLTIAVGTRAGREFFIGSLHVWSNAARLNCPSNIQATGALRPAPVLMRG